MIKSYVSNAAYDKSLTYKYMCMYTVIHIYCIIFRFCSVDALRQCLPITPSEITCSVHISLSNLNYREPVDRGWRVTLDYFSRSKVSIKIYCISLSKVVVHSIFLPWCNLAFVQWDGGSAMIFNQFLGPISKF